MPLEWVGQTGNTDGTLSANFIPRMRGEEETEPAVGGVSTGTETSLTSPQIPFGEEATLRFEWSLETVRDYEDVGDSMVQLPTGNEPGIFGAGHSFDVTLSSRGKDTQLYSANEYHGTMTPTPGDPDKFIDGTSTWVPVEVTIPENIAAGKLKFRFSTQKYSILYMRNISVDSKSGVADVLAPGMLDMICGGSGCVTLLSVK